MRRKTIWLGIAAACLAAMAAKVVTSEPFLPQTTQSATGSSWTTNFESSSQYSLGTLVALHFSRCFAAASSTLGWFQPMATAP